MEGVHSRPVHCDAGAVVIETTLEEGAEVPRHVHNSNQVTVVLEGSIVLGVEGLGEKILSAGEYMYIPPGKAHWAKSPYGVARVLDINWPTTPERAELYREIGGECL
ncbi:MAG: cupin domain-containing protein [Desulfurococcales archaeon]|nr:cupin domain-containing protein [Desulfurococcales archaeon]